MISLLNIDPQYYDMYSIVTSPVIVNENDLRVNTENFFKIYCSASELRHPSEFSSLIFYDSIKTSLLQSSCKQLYLALQGKYSTF